MSPTHRRYLLLEQGVGAAAFNFVVNAAIAWLMFRAADEVPLWGRQSIAGDTIGTSLILPLITCLVVTPMARRHVRAGRVAPLGWTRESHTALAWLPRGTFRRALVLSLVCMVALSPMTLLIITRLHVASLSVSRFVLFKASFATLEALFVTPLVAVWAIAETPEVPGAPASLPRAG
jgi:hypothetical protein